MTRLLLSAALVMLTSGPLLAQEAFSCKPAPEPVGSLSYGSRYAEDSESRSELDAKANDEADNALRPVDDFLRDLTETANLVFKDGTDKREVADCVLEQIAVWAKAGALTDLQSDTANLTIGSRIAGFGLVLLQVLPHTKRDGDVKTVKAWLAGIMRTQMLFWEEDGPSGARQGNLRLWAALAGSASAEILDDPAMRGWSAWSVSYVLCKADADGSLPQEMTRGKFALKYQFHAIAPLVVSMLLLDRQGIALKDTCDQAIGRIVDFALADMESGAATEKITGKVQSFFDGTDKIEGFHLAWLEAYLLLDPPGDRKALNALAEKWRPLGYSKLGGNQSLIWAARK